MVRTIALALTFLTGVSGLVYQIAWQKILAILLGSHSEAIAAVLALFLGGLSAGYLLFGHLSRRVVARDGSLLLTYGFVESGIGLIALLFPLLFAGIRALSLAFPQLSPGVGFALDVGLAALLVLPPTVLMGGTIPLLTQGLSSSLEDSTRFHSSVYALNTAGAFVGALAAGFWLIPSLGLEVSIRLMGLVNLAAGICFIALRKHEIPTAGEESPRDESPAPTGLAVYGLIALLSGFAMMSLQTTMNRVGALALGASHFTFSMVVAIFVLCIALGSFAVASMSTIRRSWIALSQWLLVVILLVIYPSVDHIPYWAHIVRIAVGSDVGVHGYYLAIFVAAFAAALIPLALSGALLPLLFHHLRDAPSDLGRIAGRLYAWNTAGSLLGALLGGYLLLFFVNLDSVYKFSVVALAIGATLLTPRVRLAGPVATSVALIATLSAVALLPDWRPERMAEGLYRATLAPETFADGPDAYFATPERFGSGRIEFFTDDPSISVLVRKNEGKSIVVNGKSDGNIPGDNMTTGMLALLPALMAEKHERAFVIGWGTGRTAGELAALEDIREVVVAEISSGVIEAAPFFERGNRGALASPKTRIVRGDAYRTLLRSASLYDLIISEPSNPWVTGVEQLYSLEFLEAAAQRLTPGGVYAQWFHTYETDDESIALVLATFREVFGQAAVWRGLGADLIILGFENPDFVPDLASLRERFARPDFNAQFAALPVSSFGRLIAHEALPAGVLHALELPDRVHTLMHPLLGDLAARAFYRRNNGKLPPGLVREAAEIGARNSLVGSYFAEDPGTEERRELMRQACVLSPRHCATLFAYWDHQSPDDPALAESLEKARQSRFEESLDPELVDGLAALFETGTETDTAQSFEYASGLLQLYQRHYHHGAPFSPSLLHTVWQRCAKSDPRCRENLQRALKLGSGLPRLSQN